MIAGGCASFIWITYGTSPEEECQWENKQQRVDPVEKATEARQPVAGVLDLSLPLDHRLQKVTEHTAERGLGVPDYAMSSSGPDHQKTFTAAATVAGETFAPSTGRSKKEAEEAAAETAWRALAGREFRAPDHGLS